MVLMYVYVIGIGCSMNFNDICVWYMLINILNIILFFFLFCLCLWNGIFRKLKKIMLYKYWIIY